jgi:hypothetical protein
MESRMRKLCTGNKIHPLTDYVNLWPLTVTLTLEVGDWLLWRHTGLSLWTFVPNNFIIIWSRKKLWTGHKIYRVTDNVNLLPPIVTLTLEVDNWLLSTRHCFIIVKICAKYFKIPWSIKKLWTGHKIYPATDYVNIWPLPVTLTLGVGDWLLSMTHHLIIVNIYAK